MAPSFFKRAAARKQKGKLKGRNGQDGSKAPVTEENASVKRKTQTGRHKAKHHGDTMQIEPMYEQSVERCSAALYEDDPMEVGGPVDYSQKHNSAPRQKAKIRSTPTEEGGPSRSSQREQKENCSRSSNRRRDRKDEGGSSRKPTPRTTEKKSKSSNQAVHRPKDEIEENDAENRRTNTAREASRHGQKPQNKGRSVLKGRGRDTRKPLVEQEHGKSVGTSPEHRSSSRPKKVKAEPHTSQRILRGAETDEKAETDGREDKAVTSEEAAASFLLSAIEAFKDFKENDNQNRPSGNQSSDNSGGNSGSSAKSYRRLMEAFESYQSARDQESPGGLDEKKDDALRNLFMGNNHMLEPMQRALSAFDTQGTRAAHDKSQEKAHPTCPPMMGNGRKQKAHMSVQQLPRLKEHEESEWGDRAAMPLQQYDGHRRENALSERLAGVGSSPSRRRPFGYQDDDDTTIVTFGTEGECSVELSCLPDDESTVVHLFNGDKYDSQKKERGGPSGSQQADQANSGGVLQMELHSARRSKGASASPGDMMGAGSNGPVNLKTVRFDRDGADVAWDLNFFPTQKLKEREMKKREELRKQEEEEELKRRMELWEASTPERVRQPPPGRRGRGMEAPRPPMPSAALSVDSSMGSSFNPSGVHSIAESSLTCSVRSGNTSSLASGDYTSSLASGDFIYDDDSEPMT